MATTVWTWSDNMGQAVGLELAVPLAIDVANRSFDGE